MDELVALSFQQPWLWAILEEHKGVSIDGAYYGIENRKWAPWPHLIGHRIALQASRGWDEEGDLFIADQLREVGRPARYRALVPSEGGCARGAILGTARILGAVRMDRSVAVGFIGLSADAQITRALASPWSFGPWVWLLTEVRKLREAVPAKGSLGLWRVPADIAARVREPEVLHG